MGKYFNLHEKEKERYTHLNAEFQRIARRNTKGFFSNECKEIEENIRKKRRRQLLITRNKREIIKLQILKYRLFSSVQVSHSLVSDSL